MPTLLLRSSLSTGLSPAFGGVRGFELETTPLGEGGFGVVYRAASVDGGKPAVPQVVKILKDTAAGAAKRGLDTIRALQAKMEAKDRELRAKGGRGLLDVYPVFLGAPQLSFEGTLDGRLVVGYSANDLGALGFVDFGVVLGDAARLQKFMAFPLQSRLEVARSLAEAFDLLNKHFRFIHADFKPEALFVDPGNGRCALIDFDSGAVARDPSDKPSTFGTLQDWLAPEIFAQLAATGATRVVKVDALSDAWSVNVALHYLLLGCHPLFFLSELSPRSVRAYLARYRWPDADPSFSFFDRGMASAHSVFRTWVTTHLPPEARDRFAATIDRGYLSPPERTTPGQWAAVLGSLLRPEIRSFTASESVVDGSRPVTLRWKTTGTGTLTLSPGPLDVTGRTSVDVPVGADTTFTLTLASPGGRRVAEKVRVELAKTPPVVDRFASDRAEVADHRQPARLSWAISGCVGRVTIDNGVGDVTGRSFVDVLPKADTTYRLRAENRLGAAEALVTLRVSRVAPTVAFTADRNHLEEVEPVTLTWNVSPNAREVVLEGHGPVPLSGSLQVSPRRDTNYRLVATTCFGVATVASVDVTVSKAAPSIDAFCASPALLADGGCTTLSWSVRDAAEVRIDPLPGPVAASGTVEVAPTATTTFVLTAVTGFGVESRRALTVSVWKPAALETRVTPLWGPATALSTKVTPLWRGVTPLRASARRGPGGGADTARRQAALGGRRSKPTGLSCA